MWPTTRRAPPAPVSPRRPNLDGSLRPLARALIELALQLEQEKEREDEEKAS